MNVAQLKPRLGRDAGRRGRGGSHVRMNVAQLKRMSKRYTFADLVEFPRSNERGSIEAVSVCIGVSSLWRFPRSNERGSIEAASAHFNCFTSYARSHVRMNVAQLKPGRACLAGRVAGRSHVRMNVAQLKRL